MDNIFFDDADAGGPAVVIDWQLAGKGCGAYDVSYLIGGALPAELPRETEQRLLRDYHDALVAGGVKDYGFARFVRDYERGLLSVMQTIATTDGVEMGDDRGVELIDVWMERLFARARHVDLERVLEPVS